MAHLIHRGFLDDQMTIAGDDGHHLERVRRLRAGELITVGDGEGRWREYDIESTSPGTLRVRASSDLRVEPELTPRLSIALTPTKGGRPDAIAAHLTELGVDRLLPVVSARAVVRWRRDDRAPIDRLTRIVREAAMQCRRARLPAIEEVTPLSDLAGRPGLVVADRDGVPAPDLPDPGPEGWLVIVGPEGGFEAPEVQELGAVQRLRLGPHILRSETAALAAAGALSFRRSAVGDHGGWANSPHL